MDGRGARPAGPVDDGDVPADPALDGDGDLARDEIARLSEEALQALAPWGREADVLRAALDFAGRRSS